MRAFLLMALVCACKGGAPAAAPPPQPTVDARRPADAAPVVIVPPDSVPTDPRVAELIAAGDDCRIEHTSPRFWVACEAADQLRELGDRDASALLAASCAAALRADRAFERVLGAYCLSLFFPVRELVTPHVGALLDAYEAERDPRLRGLLAYAIAHCDAISAGLEGRVIPLARASSAAPDDDGITHDFMLSLSHGHVLSNEAGDLMLELARTGGPKTREFARGAVLSLYSRLPEVCALVAELAGRPDLAPIEEVVRVVAHFGNACVDQLDRVIDALVAARAADPDDLGREQRVQELIANTTLTPSQRARLR